MQFQSMSCLNFFNVNRARRSGVRGISVVFDVGPRVEEGLPVHHKHGDHLLGVEHEELQVVRRLVAVVARGRIDRAGLRSRTHRKAANENRARKTQRGEPFP